MFLGAICCTLFMFFSKYDDQILYRGFSQYYIYIPFIVAGVYVLRKKIYVKNNIFLNWFSKFIFSVVLFYIPSMCIFILIDSFYTKNKEIKTIEITRINKITPKMIIFELDDENIKSYCQTNYDRVQYTKPKNRLRAKMSYKEGLLNTYVIQKMEVK